MAHIKTLMATAAMVTVSSGVCAQDYTITDLVDGFPVSRTEPQSINSKGNIAGWSSAFGNGSTSLPFSHAEDGGMVSVGLLPGDPSGQAYSINDKDQVVGFSFTSNAIKHAVIYLPEPDYGLPAGLHDMGTLGGITAQCRAVNNKGQAVGTSKNADGETHAFIWLPEPDYGMAAGMHQINDFGYDGFGTQSSALGINDKGQVSGYAKDAAGNNSGMLWLPQADYGMPAGLNDLGTLGGESTLCWDINEHGQIAGYSKNSSDDIHAIIWLPTPAYGLPAKTLNDLGTLGGRDATFLSINDHGDMVGWSQLPNSEYTAMVYKDGVMTDLNTVASDPAILKIDEARGINNDGSIACTGISNPEIRVRGLRLDLLEIPCPADLAEPMGALNLQDVFAYLALFNAQDPASDLAEPLGVFNLQDVFGYLGLFNAGCP